MFTPLGVLSLTTNRRDGSLLIAKACAFGDRRAILFYFCISPLLDIKYMPITKSVSILSEQMTHPSAIICLIWHGVTLFFLRLL